MSRTPKNNRRLAIDLHTDEIAAIRDLAGEDGSVSATLREELNACAESKEWPEVEPATEREQVQIYVTPGVHRATVQAAKRAGVSVSELVRALMFG